jgi:hypothetical protein
MALRMAAVPGGGTVTVVAEGGKNGPSLLALRLSSLN